MDTCSTDDVPAIKSSANAADRQVDDLLEYAADLEAKVEASATFDDGYGSAPALLVQTSSTKAEANKELLTLIANTYGEVVEIKQQQLADQGNEIYTDDITNALLDYAIACKRANRMTDCARAHLQRMKLVPKNVHTDAVRLLGIEPDIIGDMPYENRFDDFKMEEICKRGMFEAEIFAGKYRPSDEARNHGKAVCRIFDKYRYTLKRCTEYLRPYVGNNGLVSSRKRIFSASSFFNHRHEAYDDLFFDSDGEKLVGNGLQALVLLFLFGLAIPIDTLTGAIGGDEIDVLIKAGLLRRSPACASDDDMLVAEVQIFPISATDLFADAKEERESDGDFACVEDHTCLFVTDFPLESMRLTRNAVMPIGYDTLELLSLSADGRSTGRILDVCCGCGIQGIFAIYASQMARPEASYKLVLADINERAIHFVGANLALNKIATDDAYALCCNLFDGLNCRTDEFDHIISNPPFVAVPAFSTPQLQPALYSIGGGTDGMHLLRRLLASCFDFLNSTATSTLNMVTEVPNIEYSCEMLRNFLPKEHRDAVVIRVAYVEEDVETVDSYSKVREAEGGLGYARDWATPMQRDGIFNRALVLISMHRKSPENTATSSVDSGLFCFVSANNEEGAFLDDPEDAADAEDAFLTREGIAFARNSLLL